MRRGGKPVDVEPKAFDLLVYLIHHRDRVVTKEELFEQLAASHDGEVQPLDVESGPGFSCLVLRGTQPDTPDSLRDIVRRRVARLPDEVGRLLRVAAVIGTEFELPVLTGVVAAPNEEQVLAALRTAVAARLVEELGPGEYRFTHELVRATLYEELGPTLQGRLRERMREVLEVVCGSDRPALGPD